MEAECPYCAQRVVVKEDPVTVAAALQTPPVAATVSAIQPGLGVNQPPQMQPPVGARSITTVCTSCGKQHQVPLTNVGAAMICTGCNQPFVVLPQDNSRNDFVSAASSQSEISNKLIGWGIALVALACVIGVIVWLYNDQAQPGQSIFGMIKDKISGNTETKPRGVQMGDVTVSTAGQYASSISGTMSSFSSNNYSSKNVNQQICNGTYRTVEMLDIMARQMGCDTSSIMSRYRSNDYSSKNVLQQTCNGTYRTVELLDLIARKMGCNTSSIMSRYRSNDSSAANILQQICNGTYRTVELLDLIAQKMGCSTSSIMSSYSSNNYSSKNINQQICNGTYRTVELLDLIAQKMGCNTSSIMSRYRSNDSSAANILQQICNGTYRTVEMLELITKKLDE